MKLECEICGGRVAWDSMSGFRCQSCGQNYEIQMTLVKAQPVNHSDSSNACMETEAERQIQLTALIEERDTLQRELARCRNPFCIKRRKEIESQLALVQRKINIRMKS